MYSNTTFGEILKFFPREEFSKLITKHNSDHYYKSLKSYHHLLAMMYCQLSGSMSIRQVKDGFNAHPTALYHLGGKEVKRSTLSDANRDRNPQLFIDLVTHLMTKTFRQERKELSSIVELMDASPIQLTNSAFDRWTLATKGRRIQGLKLHICYHPDQEVPTRMVISDANVNDTTVSQSWEIEKDYLYVFDKGYCNYNWWYHIHQKGASFVTRLKKNANVTILENFEAEGDNIISDQRICFTNLKPRGGAVNQYSEPLRRITVNRPDKSTPMILVTNRFDLTALQIADLYKERWQIELFFKWIKQRLKIKKFIGTSKNAVMIQLLTAIITYLLLSIYKNATNTADTMTEFFFKVRATLFCRVENFYNKRRRMIRSEPDNQIEFCYA